MEVTHGLCCRNQALGMDERSGDRGDVETGLQVFESRGHPLHQGPLVQLLLLDAILSRLTA